jgi:hypothetical protein
MEWVIMGVSRNALGLCLTSSSRYIAVLVLYSVRSYLHY